MSLVARGSVDIRPFNKISEFPAVSSWIRSCPGRPLRFETLRGDEVEEDMDSGMGAADTSEIIKVKSSATRPAREYCMIVGPADLKMKRKRTPCFIGLRFNSEDGCALTDLESDVRLTGGKLYIAFLCKWKLCGTNLNSGADDKKKINIISEFWAENLAVE